MLVKKTKKYINTKCEMCHKWIVCKVCDYHKKYSYERCLKEIKKDKWDLWLNRVYSIMVLSILTYLMIMIGFVVPKKEGLSTKIAISFFIGLLISLYFWVIMESLDTEKKYKKWLKELEEEKNEWKEVKNYGK